MDMVIFGSIFITLGIIYLVLGIYASKGIETNEDYFLAGRSLGLWSLAFTLLGTQIGGGMLLGTSAESYRVGWAGMYYSLGMAVGFIVLGLGFASMMRGFNVATLPELFEVRYNSPGLRKIATIVSALSLAGITAALVVSTRSLSSGLGFQDEWMTLSFWAVIIIYTMMGGLKAVVVTDVFQVIIIAVSFIGLFIYSIFSDPQGAAGFYQLFSCNDAFISGSMNFTGFFAMPVLFSLVQQDLAQRFFAAKSRSIAASSALIAALGIALFAVIPLYFGMKAKLIGLVVPQGASPLIMVVQWLAHDWVLAVIVCAIFAAIMSTADSLLCAVGSLLAQDFGLRFSSSDKQLAFSQGIVCITGFGAVLVGYRFDNVLAVMTQSYELPVSCLLIPILACFFMKGSLSARAAGYSMLAGGIGFMLFRIWPIAVPREIMSLIFSGVGYAIGQGMSRQIE